MKVLVTGATGHVGRHVVTQLVEAGQEVVALTRQSSAVFSPAVRVVRGDLLDPPSIPFDGVSRMYLFPEPRTAREVVARAVDAGVSRIVTLSSGAVTGGYDTDYQLPVEQAVEDLSATHGALFGVAAGNAGSDRAVGSPGSAPAACGVAIDVPDRST